MRGAGGVVLGVLVATVAIVAACRGEDAPPVDDTACTGASCADAGGDRADNQETIDAACDAPAHSRTGCPCRTVGEVNPCAQGVPGPGSGCRVEGVQRCSADHVFEACVGGPVPAATDLCFDGIDNDCNGRIDDGCFCSGDRDTCRGPDGGTYDPDAYTVFTVPEKPTAGVPFELFVVSRSPIVHPVSLHLGKCSPGASGYTPCTNPGAGCGLWNVAHWSKLVFATGTYELKLFSADAPGGPCTGTVLSTSRPTLVIP